MICLDRWHILNHNKQIIEHRSSNSSNLIVSYFRDMLNASGGGRYASRRASWTPIGESCIFFLKKILRKKIECAQYQNNHIHSCRKREQNKQIVAFYFYLNNQYLVFIRLGQV